MDVRSAGATTVLTLPLLDDPWPGRAAVAVGTPAIVLASITLASLAGHAGAWVIGAAPFASLIGPLVWLARQGAPRSATVVVQSDGVRVVHEGRAPLFDRANLSVELVGDQLRFSDREGSVDLRVGPLDAEQARQLASVVDGRALIDIPPLAHERSVGLLDL